MTVHSEDMQDRNVPMSPVVIGLMTGVVVFLFTGVICIGWTLYRLIALFTMVAMFPAADTPAPDDPAGVLACVAVVAVLLGCYFVARHRKQQTRLEQND